MRCDDIHEYLIDLLYDESCTPPSEVQEHLRSCPACSRELAELKQTRRHLQAWKDESPPRSVAAFREDLVLKRRSAGTYLRYAAIAAMALICILALSNTEIRIDNDGFSFSTHLLPKDAPERDYYTKSETRDLMKRALDDSEYNTQQLIQLMGQRILETAEQEQRWMDVHLVRSSRSARNNNSN